MKIALLIPSTSNNREWKDTQDCYLYDILFKSFIITYNPEYDYTFYIGIDYDDKYYHDQKRANELQDYFLSRKINIQLKFIITGSKKGHVTDIWNKLFKVAYEEKNDYFVQLGDDILFMDKGWDDASIKLLKKNNNLGVVGLFDYTRRKEEKLLLTQTFVHRTHYDIFKFYFPSEIENWFCDDWITNIYKSTDDMFITDERISNIGGEPRYKVNNCPARCKYLLNKYLKNLEDYKISDKYITNGSNGETEIIKESG